MFGENPAAERAARSAIDGVTVGGERVRLTGMDALAEQSGGGEGPGVLVDAILGAAGAAGAAGALIVLGFVFASFLAVVPLMMAIVSILTTFLLLLGLTELTSVSPIVQFLIALIALPLPFLRSMGYGGMLISLVSTLVAITLLPVLLAKLGPRLDWPHRRTDDKVSRRGRAE